MTEEKPKIDIVINEPYRPVFNTSKRYVLLSGGRAGGRSYFASQYATLKLLGKQYFRCAMMRYISGDIRNSIYQEIIDRLEELGLDKSVDNREHLLHIAFEKNDIKGIGFKKSSGDQKAKLKSLAGFTAVIIEEAEEVSEADFNQLDESLRKIDADIKIILLFNLPEKNHWINKKWFNLVESDIEGFYKPELKESMQDNTCFIHTTYKDNEKHLNKSSIELYERYKITNPDHYWNMIMGLVPSGKRGLIYKNWKPITNIEFEKLDYTSYYALDFGFTNDECALVEIKEHNNKVYVKELIYEKGLLNTSLARRFKDLGITGVKEIIADSAEPKSIAELQTLGFNVIPSEKGAGSRKSGVNLLLEKEVYYTEDSKNLINEVQNYCWALDKNKEPTNEPSDGIDHLLDATRMGVFTKKNVVKIGFY
jgi:phage terminase large subunit